MTLKNLPANFRLNGREPELRRRVMANDELDQGAAEIAHAVE
jgi:hypothetical protein